jgi:hypothetical protein
MHDPIKNKRKIRKTAWEEEEQEDVCKARPNQKLENNQHTAR